MTSAKEEFCLKSPCKINLCLEVSHEMTGGYHQIQSVLQAVDFSDYIEFAVGKRLRVTIDPESSVSFGIQPIQDNLIFRAAQLLAKELSVQHGAHINLQKHVPLSAGLGGGSSNAAITLMGLNRLWELGLSSADLGVFAEQLGADVPFFLTGGTALATGIGTTLCQLPSSPKDWVLLVFPDEDSVVQRKTAWMYKMFDEIDVGKGPEFGHRSNVIANRIADGLTVEEYLFNSFEYVLDGAYPGHRKFKEKIEFLTKEKFTVTGSGPSLFMLTSDLDYGQTMKEVLEDQGISSVLCGFLPKWA